MRYRRCRLVRHGFHSRLSFSQETTRIQYCDFGKAFEVAVVEGEKMRDAVNQHRGDEVSVVSLLADDSVTNYKPFPFGEDFVSVGEDHEKIL